MNWVRIGRENLGVEETTKVMSDKQVGENQTQLYCGKGKNFINFKPRRLKIRVRPGKRNLTRMTQIKRTEFLPEFTPEIIDLKFTQTESDPY